MLKLRFLWLILVQTCLGNMAWAEPVSYFYSHLPPYEYQDKHQQAQGIGIDAIRQVLQSAGFSPSFELYSLQRGLNALDNQIDFTAAVSPTAAQQQQYWISQYPVYQIELGVVRLRESAALERLEVLTHAPYVVLAETKFAHLQQRPELTSLEQHRYEVAEQQDALRLILSERYRYFLTYGMTEQQLAHPALVFEELEKRPVHLILSRKNKDAERLMQRVDVVLKTSYANDAANTKGR